MYTLFKKGYFDLILKISEQNLGVIVLLFSLVVSSM